MNNALGIAVVFDFITLIAVETGLEIFVVDVDVDVVGMVDFVDVFVVIGYWLFDVGIVDVVIEGDLEGIEADFCNTVTVSCPLHALVTSEPN